MFNKRSLIMLVTILALISAALMASDGSARFTILNTKYVSGSPVNPGQYDIEWTGNPDATVVFKQIGKPQPVLTAKGKIESTEKGDYNSFTEGKDSAGRDAIKAIIFGSKKVRIVFE
jgi:hypothetical protein